MSKDGELLSCDQLSQKKSARRRDQQAAALA